MKFTPCQDLCTTDGETCQGCGRSLAEIAETKQIVKSAVALIKKQQYENPEDFLAAINKSILKKLTF